MKQLIIEQKQSQREAKQKLVERVKKDKES